jgi:hypothetical protein
MACSKVMAWPSAHASAWVSFLQVGVQTVMPDGGTLTLALSQREREQGRGPSGNTVCTLQVGVRRRRDGV